MLESSLLAMPTTTTLSVMRTFMSVPSRDVIESMGPSTASMVPRMRTVGAGWAKAVVPRTDKIASEASARGRNEDIGMDFPSQGGLRSKTEPRDCRAIPVTSSFRMVPTGPREARPDDRAPDQTRNLEIPRCAIAHLRFALCAPRNEALHHIGGVSPLRPTLIRVAS